jgi:PAS domain S-box-containing protein
VLLSKNKANGRQPLSLDLKVLLNLLELSPDAIMLVNEETRIISTNYEAESMFGYDRGELSGLELTLLVPDKYKAAHPALCEKYFSAPSKREMTAIHVDVFAKRKDGSEFPVQVCLAPLQSQQGLLGMVTVRDLTERLKTQITLKESESKYSKLIETANDAIFVIDLDSGSISEANEKAGVLLGEPTPQIVGKQLLDIFPEDEGEESKRIFDEFSKFGHGTTRNLHVRQQGGPQVPVEISTARLELNHKNIILGIFRDIREEVSAEQSLAIRCQQQAVVAAVGQKALAETDIDALMDLVVKQVARTLNIDYCKVLELTPGGEALLLRAGVGWKPGYVGQALVMNDGRTQAGYTLFSNQPVIVDDLRKETRFQGPTLLTEHGVVSGMNVIIGGKKKPFGVLGAHAKTHRVFNDDDINFLRAIANILAEAIDRSRSEETLKTKDHQIRQTYFEVFFAVTGGKLVILSEDELQESLGPKKELAFDIASYEDLGEARAKLRAAISAMYPGGLNLEEIITATGEAMTNAVKHSGGGQVSLFRYKNTLQVVIEDSGPGIDFSLLPKATLMAGFSTKQTLGIGFTIMLEFCDRLLLNTGPKGTTVVLEIAPKGEAEKGRNFESSSATPVHS